MPLDDDKTVKNNPSKDNDQETSVLQENQSESVRSDRNNIISASSLDPTSSDDKHSSDSVRQKNLRKSDHTERKSVVGDFSTDLSTGNGEVVNGDDKHFEELSEVSQGNTGVNINGHVSSSDLNTNNEAVDSGDNESESREPQDTNVGASLSDQLTSNDEDKYSRDTDSETEQVFSLTDRLLHNHRSKLKKGNKQNGSLNRNNIPSGSKRKDFVTISSDESEGEEQQNGSTKQCKGKTSFREYR